MLINLTRLQETYLVEMIFYDSIKSIKDNDFHTHSCVEICVSGSAYMITKTYYIGKAMINVVGYNKNGKFLTEIKIKYRGKWVQHGIQTFYSEGYTSKFLYKYGKWISREI